MTGASSGIGAATARAIARAGHPVVLAARRTDACGRVAAAVRDEGGEAAVVHLDLADPSSIEEAAGAAADAFGAIEIVVSNAGDVLAKTVVDTDPADFAHQVEVNLLGAQRLLHRVLPAMIERRRGDVVLVTSDVVRAPRPSMSSYVTSKWGLEGLARALQMELEGSGVRVSVVRPGPTATEMGSTWPIEEIGPVLEEWTRWGLMRHGGYLGPEAVAAAVTTAAFAPRGTHLSLIEVQPEAPPAS